PISSQVEGGGRAGAGQRRHACGVGSLLHAMRKRAGSRRGAAQGLRSESGRAWRRVSVGPAQCTARASGNAWRQSTERVGGRKQLVAGAITSPALTEQCPERCE